MMSRGIFDYGTTVVDCRLGAFSVAGGRTRIKLGCYLWARVQIVWAFSIKFCKGGMFGYVGFFGDLFEFRLGGTRHEGSYIRNFNTVSRYMWVKA